MTSLYVHFPFCESKCHYCDFYSIGRERTSASDPSLFAEALRAECELVHVELSDRVDTIFFGGGTPSMTPPKDMVKALAPLRLEQRVHSGTEWTMEANPSSVDLDNLRGYRDLGVNRISMGVQALRPDLLERLGRVHSREAAFRALDLIFEAGLENVSVDLLCGVPGQSVEDVEKAMNELLQWPITHLSCYLLTLPKTHRMFRELPNEDQQLEHLLTIDRVMTAHGFTHYEISNFARPGREARHNLAYWKGLSYLGIGPSAHSHDADSGKRWKNVSSLHRWADLVGKGQRPIEWKEELNEEQRNLEKWMLALRLREGFPQSWLDERRWPKAQELIRRGLMEDSPENAGYLRLTPRGFAVSDQIIGALA